MAQGLQHSASSQDARGSIWRHFWGILRGKGKVVLASGVDNQERKLTKGLEILVKPAQADRLISDVTHPYVCKPRDANR
eukprot:3475384-Amphidinium_carterae.1